MGSGAQTAVQPAPKARRPQQGHLAGCPAPRGGAALQPLEARAYQRRDQESTLGRVADRRPQRVERCRVRLPEAAQGAAGVVWLHLGGFACVWTATTRLLTVTGISGTVGLLLIPVAWRFSKSSHQVAENPALGLLVATSRTARFDLRSIQTINPQTINWRLPLDPRPNAAGAARRPRCHRQASSPRIELPRASRACRRCPCQWHAS